MSDFNERIWHFAEPAWREYKSAAAYVELLRAEGFEVEAGSGGMPTAFCARWGKGGPLLASFSEYDAVPGNCQAVVPRREPRAGMHPYAAGHTDPHSSLGTAALTSILATKAAMEATGTPGRLVLFGEPAEKVCGSKPVHAAKGYYDGLDAAVVYHPHMQNTVTAETQFGAYWSCIVTFTCDNPEILDRQVPAADPRCRPRRRPRAGRDRRAVPDVHDDEVHQGGDVPPCRRLDAERVHHAWRRRDLRQPRAALRADPVFLAHAVARRWRSRSPTS